MLSKKRAEFEANAVLAQERARQHEDALKAAKYKRLNASYRRVVAVVSAVGMVITYGATYMDDWAAGKYDWRSLAFIPFAIVVAWKIWRGRPDN